MKVTTLLLAFVAIASSTLVSCTSNGGPPRGMHHDDPMPAAVRRHQDRMRR
ncbi:MAG: hypothetical protein P1U68_08630 [Verrucomicrobiales bacterium]|nr:hypothetical protein [Verrucomicrobiales bacterium]